MKLTLSEILQSPQARQGQDERESFFPTSPKSLEDTGLNRILVEDLICKLLLAHGSLSGREISRYIALPLQIISDLLYELKQRLILAYQDVAGVSDFDYVLTETGREKALLARQQSAYMGAAPVPFAEYLKSVESQVIQNEQPNEAQLRQALNGLILPEDFYGLLGPAINSAKGLFLFGDPGNGKTEVATRIAECYAETIYIPKTLLVEGHLIQLYDPRCHIQVDDVPGDEDKGKIQDLRWLHIKRPAVVVGGEMDLDSLEIGFNGQTGICEASLQLKGNSGVFVVDDFGRQRIGPDKILNRWILPLEKSIDYLTLPDGSKVQVPFNAFLVFCSNYDPSKLLEEAFLRKIPYKIHMGDPGEKEFITIFRQSAEKMGIQYDSDLADYLLTKYFRGIRNIRGCHPRDILRQLTHIARYENREPEMTRSDLDKAVQLYFSVMDGSLGAGEMQDFAEETKLE